MNLSWMFGPSIQARHLLYAYVSVWLIQGGYAGWVAWQWMRAGHTERSSDSQVQPRSGS
jgi:hypothetical protein